MNSQGTRIESLYNHCTEYSKICSTTPDRCNKRYSCYNICRYRQEWTYTLQQWVRLYQRDKESVSSQGSCTWTFWQGLDVLSHVYIMFICIYSHLAPDSTHQHNNLGFTCIYWFYYTVVCFWLSIVFWKDFLSQSYACINYVIRLMDFSLTQESTLCLHQLARTAVLQLYL